MAKQTIPAMVEGGNATAGPPLGPALGQAKVNIGQVIALINTKTAAFKGLTIPVKIFINEDKTFDVEVGMPSAAALIKKELGLKENVKEEAGAKGKKTIGNLTMAQIVSIAKAKQAGSLAKTLKDGVKEIMGTCKSMGVTVEGKDPKEVQKEVSEGKHDKQIQ